MGETLARSSLAAVAPGTKVNLERSVRLEDRLGGHLVQGHVDDTATSSCNGRRTSTGKSSASASRPAWPGTSRTRAPSPSTASASPSPRSEDDWFEVSLIPETLSRTTLGVKEPGEPVNLEVDVIAKYVEKLLGGAQ